MQTVTQQRQRDTKTPVRAANLPHGREHKHTQKFKITIERHKINTNKSNITARQ